MLCVCVCVYQTTCMQCSVLAVKVLSLPGSGHLTPYTLSPTDLIVRRSTWKGGGTRPRRTRASRALGVRYRSQKRPLHQLDDFSCNGRFVKLPTHSLGVAHACVFVLWPSPSQVERLTIRSVGDRVYGVRCPIKTPRQRRGGNLPPLTASPKRQCWVY